MTDFLRAVALLVKSVDGVSIALRVPLWRFSALSAVRGFRDLVKVLIDTAERENLASGATRSNAGPSAGRLRDAPDFQFGNPDGGRCRHALHLHCPIAIERHPHVS